MSEHKMAPVKSIHWNNDKKKEAYNYWPVHRGQPNMKHGYASLQVVTLHRGQPPSISHTIKSDINLFDVPTAKLIAYMVPLRF